jgi:long-chain acyl-CoA synthetase
VLVTRRDLLPPWAEGGCLPPTVILVDGDDTRQRLLHSADVQPPVPQPLDAPHAAAATSGSTGRPRLALRSARNLLAAVDGAVEALGLRAGMRELCVVPFHSTGGFDNCLLVPLLTGMTAVVQPSFNPAAFAGAAARERVEVLMGSPFTYEMLLASGAGRAAFASVKAAVSFGAPIAAGVVRRCADELGLSIRQLYGSTETGVIAIQSAATPFAPGLAGHPIRTADVRVVDDDGAEVAAGATGRIVVRGPGVIAGYHDRDDGDAAIFRDGGFHSGDLGSLEPSGVLMLRGRSKAMINVSGIKIDPVEVEHAIKELPAVADCVVCGVVDEREREVVQATLVLREGQALTRREVIEHCRQRLAEYKLPRRIVFAAALQVDAAGKRRKAWLPDPPG